MSLIYNAFMLATWLRIRCEVFTSCVIQVDFYSLVTSSVTQPRGWLRLLCSWVTRQCDHHQHDSHPAPLLPHHYYMHACHIAVIVIGDMTCIQYMHDMHQ